MDVCALRFRFCLGTAGLGLLFATAASANSIPFQVTGIQNSFAIGCAANGCGEICNLEGGALTYVYCIDAQSSGMIPSTVFDVELTGLTSGSDLAETRYGKAVSQWADPGDSALRTEFRATTFSLAGSGVGDSLTPAPTNATSRWKRGL